jgi:hypothetical protein
MLPKPPRRGPAPRRYIARRATVPRRSARGRRRHTSAHLLELRAQERLADRLAAFLVEQREGVMAQDPGCIRRGTDPHHLLPKSSHPNLRWDLDNLAWISRAFHDWLHAHRGEMPRFGLWALGRARWEALQQRAMSEPYERPADAVARLRGIVRDRGLARLAQERGLL